MSNFKDAQGNLVDPSTLSGPERLDYEMALLLKKTIETLEMSIQNERVFSRAKFQIMSNFHEARENML